MKGRRRKYRKRRREGGVKEDRSRRGVSRRSEGKGELEWGSKEEGKKWRKGPGAG